MTARRSTPHLDALDQLLNRAAQAKAKGRALAQAVAENDHAIAALKAERIAAYAEDDERKVTALQRKADAANAKALELEERRAGAELAANRAHAEHDRYRGDHVRELLDEVKPDAVAAAKAVEDAARVLVDAWAQLSQIDARINTLTRGVDGFMHSRTPTNDTYAQLELAARRTLDSGPPQPPLPGDFHQTITIPVVDDPDDDVRDAARAKASTRRSS